MKTDRFDEYIMIAPGSDYGTAMWSELRTAKDCTFFDYTVECNNHALKLLHHVHFSFVLNKKADIPLQSVWRRAYVLEKINFDDKKRYCVIFTDISACRTDKGYLKRLSERPNIEMVMVLVNVMATKKRLISERLGYFSAVFSFDKADCEKYDLIHHPTFYSVTDVKADDAYKSDAFFIGAYKGNRYDKLRKLYKKLRKAGASPDFHIVNVGKNEPREDGIHYNKRLSYRDVLERVLGTNCVVEIMGGGQSGLTLRAVEAICYNKRLLTDNAAVKNLKYYNTGYIQYIENIEDANTGFILDKTPVDYKYDGDFSPVHLIDHINAVFAERVM